VRRNEHPDTDAGYLRRAGALLLGIANDLKRNDAVGARELGISLEEWNSYVSGRRLIPQDVIRVVASTWPVSERDLMPLRSDLQDGVVIMRAAESQGSARRLSRDGVQYYEYRDTAMSRLAGFRPEWIRMLQTVNDSDPDNPAVKWNNGHLLHQFTYFIGPVNYYYHWNGLRHCLEMDTGDSIWGLPFTPHSFASRAATADARILALTYGIEFSGDALHEAGVLGAETLEARGFAPCEDDTALDPQLLRLQLRYQLISVVELASRSGIEPRRLEQILEGRSPTLRDEATAIAHSLGISLRDLLGPRDDCVDGIRVLRRDDSRAWPYPGPDSAAYLVRGLAGSALHPWARGFELRPLRVDPSAPMLTVDEHQYAYQLGPGELTLHWRHAGRERSTTLTDGDSIYLSPGTCFSMTCASVDCDAVLLVQRIPGRLGVEARYAIGGIESAQRHRIAAETTQWYDE
jgi:methylphosphonate synthase